MTPNLANYNAASANAAAWMPNFSPTVPPTGAPQQQAPGNPTLSAGGRGTNPLNNAPQSPMPGGPDSNQMTPTQALQFLQTGQGTPSQLALANQIYYGSQSTNPTMGAGAPPTNSNSGYPNAGQIPFPGIANSTDPSVFSSPTYQAQMNQNVMQSQVNQGLLNPFTQQQFTNAWNGNMGTSSPVAGAPFDPNNFNNLMGTGWQVVDPTTGAVHWQFNNGATSPLGANGIGPANLQAGLPKADPNAPPGSAPTSGATGNVGTPPTTMTNAVNQPAGGAATPFQPPPGQTTGGAAGSGNLFGPNANNTTSTGNPPSGTNNSLGALLQAIFGTNNPSGPNFGAGGSTLATPGNGNPSQVPLNPTLGANVNSPFGTGPAGGAVPGVNPNAPNPATTGVTPDMALAQAGASGSNALQSIVAGGGNPVNTTPAWQQMVAAQQQNIDIGQSNLAAQFNNSDNLDSTAFGLASSNYQQQAQLGENAQLSQSTLQALEQAQQVNLQAGTSLAGFGNTDLQQLSSQGFQSQQLQQQLQEMAGSQMLNAGTLAANSINQTSAGATEQLNQASVGAGNNLFGTETSAAMAQAQQDLALQQMGLSSASGLSSLYQSNLGLGNTLGTSQYSIDQAQLNNLYQLFQTQSPQNNPLLSMLQSAALGYPQMYNPSFQPGMLGQLISGLAQGAGTGVGLANSCWIAESIYGTLDPRTFAARRWLNGPFSQHWYGSLVMKLYRRIGRQVAKVVKRYYWLQLVLKPLFNIAVRKGTY